MDKPDYIFDRDFEWRHLAQFAGRAGERPQLGVVTGRRRQGKTYLLEALAASADGLYFGATQATASESLARFGDAVGGHLDSPVPLRAAAAGDERIQLVGLPELYAPG
ncbi:MAG: hypothetical protein ACRDT2_09235 [Natronosporangium sp.]